MEKLSTNQICNSIVNRSSNKDDILKASSTSHIPLSGVCLLHDGRDKIVVGGAGGVTHFVLLPQNQ